MNNKNLNINKIQNRAAIIGVVVIIIAWVINMITMDINFSFANLAHMHITNPILFIIDALPICFYFIVKFFSKVIKKRILDFEAKIKDQTENIRNNAQFAQKIGEGDFSFDQMSIDKNDVLGKSLIKMRNDLVASKNKEDEQNWIAQGKDKISTILRLHTDINDLAYDTLVNLINYTKVTQGAFYVYEEDEKKLVNVATFAYNRKKYQTQEFKLGQGLIGQSAYEMDTIYRTEIPDDYVTITSGILGEEKPSCILIVPLITDDKLQGVIEFASLEKEVDRLKINFVEELSDILARTIFNLKVNSQTEKLLKEAQEMTEELRENEEELRQNAEEMRVTHDELEKTNENLEKQILEVENAQKRLHSLLENASEVISIYDDNLKLKYISPSVAKIYGYSVDEMIEGKDMGRLTSQGVNEMKKAFKKLLSNPNTSLSIQYTYMRKDGEKIFIESTGRNLIHDPAISGIIINSQDITERKRAEKEERMKSQMQALSENSPDMIIRFNTEGQFFYVNPIVKIFTGIDTKNVIKKSVDEVNFNSQIIDFFKDTIRKVKETQHKVNTEIVFPTNFGDRVMQVNSIPEFNEEKELETILVVAHDITEMKNIEMEIQDKNKKITESINYAKRIQGSILPDTKFVQTYLPNSFIFYKPKDVVSGDFPWFFKKKDTIYISAVDCTGHGVPGALLSFIGYFLLNNIVDHEEEYNAGQVLDRLHYGVRKTLKQDQSDANARDGMDIALCKIDLAKSKLEYAGAHRPLYLLRNGELSQYKGNRKAIGGIPLGKKPELDFQNHIINFEVGDKIFFFSDGLTDQLGGPNKRKYQASRIRELLTEHSDFTMVQYSNFFARDFKKWKGETKQIDDVLLIGIEF
ncbi:MAG: PAS domain S-box protein [Bacteroidetes bacterium]|nr:PAS domain S-box protein [Bacteroidota bacterium]